MGKFESYPSINSLSDDDITLYNHNTVTHKINFARLAQLIKTKVSESIPIQGSTNLVTSGGIYSAIQTSADSKADKATTLEGYGITNAYNMVESNIRFIPKYSIDSSDWDNAPTASSTNPVVSNGVYEAIRDATTDMVGATASADGTRGLVPKPSAGDEDKVLKGDGTWGEVTSSSSISTLTDVDLTNISDGQLLRYNGTSQKWENIGVDTTPTQNSTNPVSSGGVYTGLGEKQPTYSADSTAWDTAPTASSTKPVTSGGILTDINSKVSHENLLDNPWFTVNQRGQNSYTSSHINTYSVDRWRLEVNNPNHSITVNNDGSLTITNSDSSALLYFSQSALKKDFLIDVGTEYVASIDVLNYSGDIYVDVGLMDESPWTSFANGMITSTGINVFKGTVPASWGGTLITFRPLCMVLVAGASLTIKAVKFERGTVSTLAIDGIPNYTEELAKCQRYFVRIQSLPSQGFPITVGMAALEKEIRAPLTLPAPMRTRPSVVVTNIENLIVSKNTINGNVGTPSSVEVHNPGGLNSNVLNLVIKFTGSVVLTVDSPYSVIPVTQGGKDLIIDFSADL